MLNRLSPMIKIVFHDVRVYPRRQEIAEGAALGGTRPDLMRGNVEQRRVHEADFGRQTGERLFESGEVNGIPWAAHHADGVAG